MKTAFAVLLILVSTAEMGLVQAGFRFGTIGAAKSRVDRVDEEAKVLNRPRVAAVKSLELGHDHSCALFDDGTVKCWGDNAFGQLGQGHTADHGDNPGETSGILAAINLGAGRTAKAITASDDNTCSLLDNGSVKCWGQNDSGQLGLGDTAHRGDHPAEMGDSLPSVDLGTGRTALSLSSGDNHTCALLDDGTVKCWGDNAYGQLGLGSTTHLGDHPNEMGDSLPAANLGTNRRAVAISAADSHTCALLDDGSVKCWGLNDTGQLGLGHTENRGDSPNEMGDFLPAVDLGSGRTVVSLAAGDHHTCAVLDDDTVKCWGENARGQLGLGDTADRGDNPGEMGDNLPAVSLGAAHTVTALAAGANHFCQLQDDGKVKCWGDNTYGQLGLGLSSTDHRGDQSGEMGDNLPTVDLGTGVAVVSIYAGGNHTCAVLRNTVTNADILKCWGANDSGQLGLGHTDNRGDTPGEMGDNLTTVLSQ